MIAFCLVFISFIMAQTEINKVFDGSLSYYAPYVGDNGINKFFELGGDHLVMCNLDNFDYTQLGYESPDTLGYIKTKNPIKRTNFLIEIEFYYKPTQNAGGAGFWLAEDVSIGNLNGMNEKYKHVGVLLDGKKNITATFVKSLDENNNFKPRVTVLTKYRERSKLSFQVLNNNLSVVMISAGKKYELYDGHVIDLHKFRFGITVNTGKTDNGDFVIYKILGQKIKPEKAVYIKGETKKSKRFVYILGFIIICGLGYYRFISIKTKSLAE